MMVAMFHTPKNVAQYPSVRLLLSQTRDRFLVWETDVVVLQVRHPLFAAQRGASVMMSTVQIRKARKKKKKRANLSLVPDVRALACVGRASVNELRAHIIFRELRVTALPSARNRA